ncbi:MAG: acyltransferase family protein, partial [Methylocella sp.]
MAKRISTSHFYSLDVLRGVAALSVVLWHWQHFFLPLNKLGVSFSIEQQPMFEVLYVFYEKGYLAVRLFFCLSGFIFFWLYSERIAEKALAQGAFAVLR